MFRKNFIDTNCFQVDHRQRPSKHPHIGSHLENKRIVTNNGITDDHRYIHSGHNLLGNLQSVSNDVFTGNEQFANRSLFDNYRCSRKFWPYS
jgi:hypothetical protein